MNSPNEPGSEPAATRIATAADMRDLGRRLAARLRPGDLVILAGPLGAGKTTLVQGIGAGLGVRGPVTSPTFVIARVHPVTSGPGPALVHADAYRLGSVGEVDDLDLDADAASAVTVVEWGSGLAEVLAEDRLEISIEPDPDGDVRTVRLIGHGQRWHGALTGAVDRLYLSAVLCFIQWLALFRSTSGSRSALTGTDRSHGLERSRSLAGSGYRSLAPVRRIAPSRTVPRTRRRAVPEQDYPPPRRQAGSYRPDRFDEEPPPWADLPPAPPARPRRAARGGHVAGPGSAGRPGAPDRLGGLAGPGDSRQLTGARQVSDPQWAGPDADRAEDAPAVPARGPGGRALRAAARRRRRWFAMGCGVLVVAAAVVTTVLLTRGQPGPATVTSGTLITTFQPGELRQVPDACRAVPAATVAQYLPGQPRVASPLPVNGSAESACDWTVDKPPVYRLMELSLLAYAPNGLASGDGSATSAAIDAYHLALQDLQSPPRHSPDPRAAVRPLSGLGNQAFSALQVFRVGGAVTDVTTVTVRYRNVVVTVTLNGLQHSNSGNYGPVSPSQLAAAVLAFARAAMTSLH